MTGIILILAANTAFNGFPVLGSILARDGFAPRQLGSRGDRLAYSNGILFLAGLAMVLILAFDAEPTRLIQLYIVGVFVAFTAQPARHGPPLDPPPEDRVGLCDPAADDPLAGDQRLRPEHDRHGARGRGDHQVPRRARGSRSSPWGSSTRSCERSGSTTTGSRRSWSSRTATRSCRAGCTRSCSSPSCTSRRCGRWPTPRRAGRTSSRRSSSTWKAARATSWWTSGTRSGSTYR